MSAGPRTPGRRRLFSQLAAETLLLAAAGGMVGVAGAFAIVRVLLHYGGAHLPRIDALAFDPAASRRAGAAPLEAAVRGVDPSIIIERGTMTALVDGALQRQRLGTALMSGFGVVALVLAVVGIFGVLAFLVSQRTAEMAVRQAFGATRARVFWMIVGNVAGMAGVGLAIGTLAAWWTGAMMSRYVYAVPAWDPIVLAGSAALVALCALCATIVPARRAAMLEPAAALRL